MPLFIWNDRKLIQTVSKGFALWRIHKAEPYAGLKGRSPFLLFRYYFLVFPNIREDTWRARRALREGMEALPYGKIEGARLWGRPLFSR